MVEHSESTDRIFRALADPSRRAILQQLHGGDCTIGELAEPLAMSFAGASKHVGILEQAGLLARRKRGRERVCSLQPDGLFVVRDWIATYSRFWDERLDALDAALKGDGDE